MKLLLNCLVSSFFWVTQFLKRLVLWFTCNQPFFKVVQQFCLQIQDGADRCFAQCHVPLLWTGEYLDSWMNKHDKDKTSFFIDILYWLVFFVWMNMWLHWIMLLCVGFLVYHTRAKFLYSKQLSNWSRQTTDNRLPPTTVLKV